RGDRAVRLIAVVHTDQLEFAPMHAALGVHLIEGRVEPELHAEPERGGRPFEHGGLAERDGVGGDAILSAGRSGNDRAERDGGKRAAKRKMHEFPHGLWATVRRLRKMEAASKGMLNNS